MKRRKVKGKGKKRITKWKLHKHIHYIKYYQDYLIEFANVKALGLNSKKRMKQQIVSLLRF